MASAKRRYTETSDYLDMLSRMFRAAGHRVGVADTEDLVRLIGLRNELDVAIQQAVTSLRSVGFTWQTIGEATGTTRQAALMKWNHPDVPVTPA